MDPPVRVVVIDDDANLLHALTGLLADYGITVAATATDGCQALPALVHAADHYGRIDALIFDERMPHTSGMDATRLLRRFFPHLPVILHTAYAHHLGDAPLQAGVTAQVSKADHPRILIDTIRAACNPTPATASA